MNLKNIKLVVSDMDGTLLNSQGKISQQFFKLYEKLQQKNITFCAASGRQHNSIVDKLHPIKNDIYVIAENGGVAKKGKTILLENVLSAEKILEVIPAIRKIKGANFVLCGKHGAFIESKDKKFIALFQEYYYNFTSVDDVTKIVNDTDFFKVAVYHFDSSEEFVYPNIQHLKDDFLLKVSGTNWLDISSKEANKGNALKVVQNILNISKEETLVFGDYHNDIEMIQQASYSVAMGNAHKDIKALATITTKDNNNFGVEFVLEDLLKQQS
ncbi:HAD family hydrolase [Polaribacter sp.]|nr:HAD family hydrolase [Polaribacter sp.]